MEWGVRDGVGSSRHLSSKERTRQPLAVGGSETGGEPSEYDVVCTLLL